MNNIKKILIGAAGAGIIAGAVIMGGSNPSPMTLGDFNTLIKVYDYEIDAAGGDISLQNIRSNAIDKFNQVILSRQETNNVTIDGTEYTPQQYMDLRQSLINKENSNIQQ